MENLNEFSFFKAIKERLVTFIFLISLGFIVNWYLTLSDKKRKKVNIIFIIFISICSVFSVIVNNKEEKENEIELARPINAIPIAFQKTPKYLCEIRINDIKNIRMLPEDYKEAMDKANEDCQNALYPELYKEKELNKKRIYNIIIIIGASIWFLFLCKIYSYISKRNIRIQEEELNK